MTLKTIVLKNFRAYRDEIRIEISNFTALIGKNDAGKSTVLEALEIFFNSELIKIDGHDPSKGSLSNEVTIGCVFSNLPAEVILDTQATTTFDSEYLLNPDGDLEIQKVFTCGKQIRSAVFARALHPSAEGFEDLHQLKNSELKNKIDEMHLAAAGIDRRNNPSMRKALWGTLDDLHLAEAMIPLDKDNGKEIWESIQRYLPLFQLFQADRPSKDEDSEVQDPMKLAIAEALKELDAEIVAIKQKVEEKTTEVAERTIEKLRDMDPGLAVRLKPFFRSEPKWDGIFKLALEGDDGIPINKRGSGVRRMILLSFFRAEAERRQEKAGLPGIIYAIEEPETSQHPSYQKLIVDALGDLAEQDGCQVVITTHVSALAGSLPKEAIRYIKRDGGRPIVSGGNSDVYRTVADDLGVLPDNRVKVLVCVEGPHDVACLKSFSRLWNALDASIPDLNADPRVAFLPQGGANLQQWISQEYLKEFGRAEVHLYDRGSDTPPSYQAAVDQVNAKGDRYNARLLNKREMENYLHPDAIRREMGVEVTCGANDSVPSLVAELVYINSGNQTPWNALDPDNRGKKISAAKKRLNGAVVQSMTLGELQAMDTDSEIEAFLRTLSGFF